MIRVPPEKRLDDIENHVRGLVNKCVDFANEQNKDHPERRLFRLHAAYVVAVDALTQGIKRCSSEFMKKLEDAPKDVRKDNR